MEYYKENPPKYLSEYDVEFFLQTAKPMSIAAGAHIHSAIEILYIRSGNYKIDLEGHQAPVSTGDIILIPSNTVHSIYNLENNEASHYVLKLAINPLFQIFKGVGGVEVMMPFIRRKAGDKFIFKKTELSKNITELLEKMTSCYNENNQLMLYMEKIYTLELIIYIFKDFFVNKSEKDGFEITINGKLRALIYKSVEYINDNYASDITPVDCAKDINLSYSYYAKLFHAVTGKSFKEYLSGIRLAKAYNAIILTDLPITEIALSCGYKNHAYFSSEFKKYYGVTPSIVRKSVLN